MTQDNTNLFIVAPRDYELRAMRQLSARAYLVLRAMLSFRNSQTNSMHASAKTIGSVCGKSERTVQIACRELQEKGYTERADVPGKLRAFYFPGLESDPIPPQKPAAPNHALIQQPQTPPQVYSPPQNTTPAKTDTPAGLCHDPRSSVSEPPQVSADELVLRTSNTELVLAESNESTPPTAKFRKGNQLVAAYIDKRDEWVGMKSGNLTVDECKHLRNLGQAYFKAFKNDQEVTASKCVELIDLAFSCAQELEGPSPFKFGELPSPLSIYKNRAKLAAELRKKSEGDHGVYWWRDLGLRMSPDVRDEARLQYQATATPPSRDEIEARYAAQELIYVQRPLYANPQP